MSKFGHVCASVCKRVQACKRGVQKENGLKMHQDVHLCEPARSVGKCTLNDRGKGSGVKETILSLLFNFWSFHTFTVIIIHVLS